MANPGIMPNSMLVLLLGIFTFSSICNFAASESKLPLDPFDPLGPWHQRHLDCGIPPFTYRLPQDIQDKIHTIWLNYEMGEDCDAEQEQTRAVIMAIPEDVRTNIFKGVCGPSFLRNESDEVADRFRQVWFNEGLSVEQKQTEFQKLSAELLIGEASKRFEKFDKKLSEQIQQRQQMLQQLSAPAREAYDKWVGMRKEERQFLASLPADVRAQLGLLCTCCGTCKTGQKVQPSEATTTAAPTTTSRAERSALVDAERLAKGLARSEAMALASAADAECIFY